MKLRNQLLIPAFATCFSTLGTADASASDRKPDSQGTALYRCTQNSATIGWDCQQRDADPNAGNLYLPVNQKPSTSGKTRNLEKADLYKRMDWRPMEWLEQSEIEQLPSYCDGMYVQPEYVDSALLEVDPQTQPLRASAQRSEGVLDGTSTLVGDVVIQQGSRVIESEVATINRNTNVANIDGEAKFREPGILVMGENAEVFIDEKRITLNNAEFVAHANHLRGTAETLEFADKTVLINRGEFTRCEPGVNSWALRSKKLDLDQNTGIGVAKHATLRVKNVPVFYAPYLQFPIDDQRKSGFLFPGFTTSSDGLELQTPYYFNIAPNYDATLTPRYIADRGPMTEAELRFLRPHQEGIFSGGYLLEDDEFADQDRWIFQMKQRGSFFNLINTNVDYSSLSDEDYFADLGSGLNVTSRTYVARTGSARIVKDYWRLSAKLQGFQILDDDLADASQPYDKLPEIKLEVDLPHESTNLELGITGSYAYFDRDNTTLINADQAATTKTLSPAVGTRVNLDADITWNLERPFAFFRPKAGIKHISYELDDLDTSLEDAPGVTTPMFSLDSGLFFERDTSILGVPLLQTFEPRLYYLNVEAQDQSDMPDFDTALATFSYSQMFREDRFIGGDRIGDTEQLSVGLSSRFLDNSGFERFRLSVGEIFNFKDREITLSGSPSESDMVSESAYVSEVLFALRSGWRIRGNIEWDPNNDDINPNNVRRTNESSISLRYQRDNRHIFNIGYRARWDRQEIEQTDISLIWPLSRRWSFIGRYNRDIIEDREVEALAGLEYQSCCWSVRLVGRAWINDEDLFNEEGIEEREAIYLQIQFKGLAGVGNSLESILQNSIAGYRERDGNDF